VIHGKVNAHREATLELQVRGPEGQVQEMEAVIDKGRVIFDHSVQLG